MGTKTKIGWTHHTANLWWGCQEIHEGCDHCYARTFDKRVGGNHWGAHSARRMIRSVWGDLAKWQKDAQLAGEQRRVFCGSMMDIFEVSKPLVNVKGNPLNGETSELRSRLFGEVVPVSPNLLFLFLTKRPQNIAKMIPAEWLNNPPANVMYGYSAVNQKTYDQGILHLLKVPGRHFLSCEPLIGEINFGLLGTLPADIAPNYTLVHERIHWIICGGESGHKARPMAAEWARGMREQCAGVGVPFFMKQMGGHPDPHHELDDIPADLQVREFPATEAA